MIIRGVKSIVNDYRRLRVSRSRYNRNDLSVKKFYDDLKSFYNEGGVSITTLHDEKIVLRTVIQLDADVITFVERTWYQNTKYSDEVWGNHLKQVQLFADRAHYCHQMIRLILSLLGIGMLTAATTHFELNDLQSIKSFWEQVINLNLGNE